MASPATSDSSIAERLRANATEIAGTLVTGIWMAALFTGQNWWLAALLVGYVVVVPIVSLLFGDRDEIDDWWDDMWSDDQWGRSGRDERENQQEPEPNSGSVSNSREALDTLRTRYARGELTDEQFERKLERLLDTETLEDVEDRARERERLRE